MHAPVTMGAGQVTWPWWDAPGDSAIGALMPGHSATDINNVATVQVSDRRHPSTRGCPSYEFGDEHYTFSSNVRGTHHVLMTLDEESYDVGFGRHQDGRRPPDRVVPDVRRRRGSGPRASATSPPPTSRTAATTTCSSTSSAGWSWVAGTAGRDSDCGGTVWSNFTPDRARRRPPGVPSASTSRGRQGLLDRDRRAGDPVRRAACGCTTRRRGRRARCSRCRRARTTSPRTTACWAWRSTRGSTPTAASTSTTRRARIRAATAASTSATTWSAASRSNAEGDAVVAGSEQEILRVPKVKVGNDNQDGVAGQNTYSAHVGGGSLSFDSAGNLYLGTGDDADPFGEGARLRAARPALPGALRRPQHVGQHERPARQGAAHPAARERRRRARAGPTYAIPDGNMFAPGRRARGRRSSRWASATRSRCRPTR